jgi:hypothetical protein
MRNVTDSTTPLACPDFMMWADIFERPADGLPKQTSVVSERVQHFLDSTLSGTDFRRCLKPALATLLINTNTQKGLKRLKRSTPRLSKSRARFSTAPVGGAVLVRDAVG